MNSSYAVPCLSATLLAPSLHLVYFNHGEHHRQPWSILGTVAMAYVIAVMTCSFAGYGYRDTLNVVTLVFISFALSLFSSIILYRAFFHRLRHFPGPSLAKLSKLWHIWQVRHSDNYRRLEELHAEYGDIVRIGPTELSICNPNAIEIVLGSRSRCTKAPWYDVALPLVSVHMTRDRATHDKRRRVWDNAFTATASKVHEAKVLKHSYRLIARLSSLNPEPIDISRWIKYFSFDAIGEIGFSHDFRMLETGTEHEVVQVLHKGQAPFGFLFPAPWLFLFLSKIRFLAADFHRFTWWCDNFLRKRYLDTPKEPDILSALIGDQSTINPRHRKTIEEWNKEQDWRSADTRLLVVAGSDTTAAALVFACCELARHPEYFQILRNDLAKAGVSPRNIRNADLASSCTHLNAFITEVLRLHPPTRSSLLRNTPPEGIMINKRFIPGNITVGIPAHVVNRSLETYAIPLEFIPERWSTRPYLVKNRNVYSAFGLGPYGCVGKQLGMMELRIVIALMVMNFESWSFAEGEDGTNLTEKSKDVFTMMLEKLWLVFKVKE